MKRNIAGPRRDYALQQLEIWDVDPDPIRQFHRWFDQALAAEVKDPNAMALATADADARPSVRFVLLKDADARGFTFYTNFESRKGRELDVNPRAALAFFWPELERQIRIEGAVGRVDDAEADAYFQSRPRGSRIGAWASPQSQPVVSRGALEDRVREVEELYGGEIPRPPFWGGYRVVPDVLEFWQGRPNRLHDRIRFTRRPAGDWSIERLAP